MPLAPGTEAPAFSLPGADGVQVSSAQVTGGGAAVLAFFKTSCPTCRLAFPVYGELARRYGDLLPVVAVSQDPLAAARPWLEDMGFPGPALDDAEGHYSVSSAFGVRSVPTLVLVEGGKVAATSEGWDRERVNAWAEELGRRTGRSTAPVSDHSDGRPPFKPG
jgi:peroxiredoxin